MNQVFHKLSHLTLLVAESKYTLYVVILLLCLFVGRLIPDPAGFRWVIIGMVIFLLFTITVGNVRKGIIAMLIFLPFLAFLRRALYSVSSYMKFDPIHLIIPSLVLFISIGILLFDKKRLSQTFKHNNLAKYITVLLGLFVLQILNPLQKSLLVGLGGSLYYVVPMMWFFFALCYANNQLIHKLMSAIVVIGVITGVYGLYQMAFGFFPFEEYWIEHGGFASLHVGKFIRAFSTFSSAEEYSRYLQISAVIAFGYFLGKRSPIWLLMSVLISFITIMTGVRASVFGLAFSILVLSVIWRAKCFRHAFIWLILLGSTFLLIGNFFSPPSREAVYGTQSIFYAMGAHTARGFTNPTGETTFQSRLIIWRYLFTDTIWRNPVGYGLGSTSIAATKFGDSAIGTESYIFSIFVNSGLLGGLLILVISLLVLKKGIILCFQANVNKPLASVILSLTAGLILNNVFGNSFTLYSIAPIGWFLVGWIAKAKYSDERNSNE